MSEPAFDTKKAMTRLRDEAGFEQRASEAMVNVLADVMDDVATKTFVRDEITALEQRLDSRFDAQMAHMEKRFAEQSAEMDRRFADVDRRFAEVDRRFAEQSSEMDRRFAEVNQRFAEQSAAMEKMSARFEHALVVQTRWMVSVMVVLTGLFLAIEKLF